MHSSQVFSIPIPYMILFCCSFFLNYDLKGHRAGKF